MYLRFQGRVPNLGTASQLGIFQLAFELRDRHDAPDYVSDELAWHLTWLKGNLTSPSILDKDEHYRAICWFTDAAEEPLAHIWPMKAHLEEFGYCIDLLKTSDPGTVIFRDGWQVIAKPRRVWSRFVARARIMRR
ncbi:MAG: hypothetical protein ABL901_13820 [Hyphomicrobiaceae bacterium]